MTPTITMTALLAVAVPQGTEAGSDHEPRTATSSVRFDPPIRLTAGDKPLGQGILYPSPRLHDIDRDGSIELVIGDLSGRVLVAEKTGDGLTTWDELKPFQTDGRVLKFHNW